MNTVLPLELILINDSSEDATLRKLEEWLNNSRDVPAHILSISIYTSKKQQFETRCDAFGIEKSNSKFVLEIQADMQIFEKGFDEKMFHAINSRDDLIGLSGRGCHTFKEVRDSYLFSMGAATFDQLTFGKFLKNRIRSFLRLVIDNKSHLKNKKDLKARNDEVVFDEDSVFPEISRFRETGRAGKLGEMINFRYPIPVAHQNTIWLSETVMRGPLMLDKHKFLEVSGFDIKRFFLGYDEHDLFMRASMRGYRCGYVPVDFYAPLLVGSSRSKRTFATELAFTRKILYVYFRRKNTSIMTLASKLPNLKPEIIKFQ